MTTEDAFKAGSGFDTLDTWTLIVGSGCVVALLISAWVLVSCYRGWAKNNLDTDEATTTAMKTVLVIVVLFWILLS